MLMGMLGSSSYYKIRAASSYSATNPKATFRYISSAFWISTTLSSHRAPRRVSALTKCKENCCSRLTRQNGSSPSAPLRRFVLTSAWTLIAAPYRHRQLHIHAFVFDEHFRNLQGLGSTVELVNWYEPGIVLTHMIFRCGADEELLLVDNTDRARILSLTTRQFR